MLTERAEHLVIVYYSSMTEWSQTKANRNALHVIQRVI
jgi:hypothetical protein